MSQLRFRAAATLATTISCLALFPAGAFANAKVCRSQEQRYEQIERQPSSIEMNAALFSAADKGCLDLVKRLLEAGASVEARDRLGAKPLARAAAAGEPEIVTLLLDHGAPIDAQSLDGSTALYPGGRGRAAAGRAPPGRTRREGQPSRPHRDNAALRRGLYGQRADRAVLDRQGRRSEIDRYDAEDGHRLRRGPGLFSGCAPASRPWRRRQRQIWQRSHRADVGGGLLGRSRRQGRGRGHDAPASIAARISTSKTIAAVPR